MSIPCQRVREIGRVEQIGRSLATWAVPVALIWAMAGNFATSGWQPPELPLTKQVALGTSVSSLAYSPDGRLLASADLDGVVTLWDRETGQGRFAFRGKPSNETSIAFSPDGTLLAIGGWDSMVRFWDIDAGAERAALDVGTTGLIRLRWSPDGSLLAVLDGTNGSIALREYPTGRRRAVLPGHKKGVRAFAFAPDGQLLARAEGDGEIEVWTTATGARVGHIKAHRSPIKALVFSPDGALLASAARGDTEVRLWSVPDGASRQTIHVPNIEISALAYSASGLLFAATMHDGGLRSYDIATGRERTAQSIKSGGFKVLASSPDGRELATGGFDQRIQFWDVSTVITGRLPPHSSHASAVE